MNAQARAEQDSLHPLGPSPLHAPRDTSIDTSYTITQDGDPGALAEIKEVHDIFGSIGVETQGPAGAAIPEHPRKPPTPFENIPDVADAEFDEYLNPSDDEAAPNVTAPHPKIGHLGSFTVEELQGDDQAEAAAEAASKIKTGMKKMDTVAMLDAMEEAEAEYVEDHEQANTDSPSTTQHTKHSISQTLRQKVQSKLKQALEANPQYSERPHHELDITVQGLEEKIYETTHHSLIVYQSVASNLIRLASSEVDVEQALLLSLGTASLGQHGTGKGWDHMDVDEVGGEKREGLQGYVVKVDYT